MKTKRNSIAALFAMLVVCTGMMADQCQQDTTGNGLAGLWALETWAVTVRVTFTVNNGGEVETTSSDDELAPLDPGDFPAELADLVGQWNAGLVELNTSLDAALPDVVGVEFPQFGNMRIFDPNDMAMQGTGIFNNNTQEYLFVGDLSGAGMGDEVAAGGVLQAAAVTGQFDRAAQTTSGEITRGLLVTLLNTTGGVAFTVEIRVAFTGHRTGDLPM